MIENKTSVTDEQKAEIKRRIETAKNKPLIVTVMWQTGVGKTSLINALFGTKMKTNDIQPETKISEKHIERSKDGHELWFWDILGIGESSSADANYLNDYRQKILEADVAPWLCHVDN
ncbi:MAG: 50S ribosome-binding GTPase [Candidatus Marithrix sp.]